MLRWIAHHDMLIAFTGIVLLGSVALGALIR